jgi:hypothetical protein
MWVVLHTGGVGTTASDPDSSRVTKMGPGVAKGENDSICTPKGRRIE